MKIVHRDKDDIMRENILKKLQADGQDIESDLIYLSMATGIDIPSIADMNKSDLVESFVANNKWGLEQVKFALLRSWITKDKFDELNQKISESSNTES